MTRNARLGLAVGALALVGAGLTASASAEPAGKVLTCHGTASETNPYVLISVSENALAGHFDGTAPGHGPRNNPDFLLPEGATECGDGPGDGGGGGGGDF